MTHSPTTRVPVGFRFHPTDEELVGYYLPKKVAAKQIDLDLIKELDLYKLEPWDLQDLCKTPDTNEKHADYYFFSRKDKKYPTGNRANRATTAGFWKATGRDKPICTKVQQLIGMRKTLVFYEGRAPHGNKTDWIMHEFRLDDGPRMPAHDDGGWVVCRVFKKTKNFKMKSDERAASFEGQFGMMPEIMSSPEILSGAGSSYPVPNNPLVHCKQETNLVTSYNVSCHDSFNAHLAQLAGMSQLEAGNHAMPLSAAGFKGLVQGRNVTRKDTGGFFSEQYALENDHNSPSFFTAAARCNENNNPAEDTGLPALDDWGTLCESTAGKADLRFPTTARGDQSLGDVHILLQLKRQISDLYSSNCEQLDPWNFNQMYQK
ncbi:hypothetical protein CY35_15G031800 [Sphagnum magellanicum]|nr:hypothetical protein CY35_15G031800 [Sphagnum magellanicum]KAH9538897.1 hypothetical protein CY35_15G031800 [Sphagnum magellanicum]KAH9538898.1 hypothetical protein CY35_15G031800 [Sphagnum magellanicum]